MYTSNAMAATLRVEGDEVRGEVALLLAPGTLREAQDSALDEALREPLHQASQTMGVFLVAAPSAFARPLPGKDEAGCTRFEVHGRVEGERLVPIRKGR